MHVHRLHAFARCAVVDNECAATLVTDAVAVRRNIRRMRVVSLTLLAVTQINLFYLVVLAFETFEPPTNQFLQPINYVSVAFQTLPQLTSLLVATSTVNATVDDITDVLGRRFVDATATAHDDDKVRQLDKALCVMQRIDVHWRLAGAAPTYTWVKSFAVLCGTLLSMAARFHGLLGEHKHS